MASPVEDYALLGDCKTTALVARNGSIDWLCWPRFDSPACFSALLGGPENGRWLITPRASDVRVRRHYREGTLVLDTVFETPGGTAVVTDFMPVRGGAEDLVRIVTGQRGEVALRMELIIRFDYGTNVPWVSRMPDGALRAIAGPDMLLLRTTAPLRGEGLTTVSEFSVAEGQSVPFVLTYSPSHAPLPAAINAGEALARTEDAWRDWSGRCKYTGEWEDAVVRSHIVLKALTYGPTGGIVAAPTTSLPEQLGGCRNWDYRFCWLRDATFTLLSLMDAGYYDEAQAWHDWLLRAVAGSPSQIQIMYGLAGERRLSEWEAPWLPGYENSTPVRVGNAAHSQFQLDVYGEVMDAFHQARRGGLPGNAESWQLQRKLIEHLETEWTRPDEGIWEVRGGRRHFTHSKVMAWVAVDRAIKGIEQSGLEGPVERWRRLRQDIHEDVCRHGVDHDRGVFVQSYGSRQLDASALLISLVGFLPCDDPRIRNTVAAIERDLAVDGLILRYDTGATDDGLPPGEGAFLACSFWLADNLILMGRQQEARRLFERLLGFRNDVGLLAEEYDPALRRQLGNFPQAFSHVALANTARNLTMHVRPAEQRSRAQ